MQRSCCDEFRSLVDAAKFLCKISLILCVTAACRVKVKHRDEIKPADAAQHSGENGALAPHRSEFISGLPTQTGPRLSGPEGQDPFRANQLKIDGLRRLGGDPSEESISILINSLMKVGPFVADPFNLSEMFPATDALTQIGEPAVPQMQKRFEETNNTSEQQVLAHTLVRIKGKSWVVSYLASLAETSRDPNLKKRSHDLQSWVQSLSR